MSRLGRGPVSQAPRSGVVLLLLTGIISLLAILATTFLVRMAQESANADDTLRLAQNRLTLHAACSYLQESARLGYGTVASDGTLNDRTEGWGWIDPRVEVPAGESVHALETAHWGGELRIGPFDADGNRLWSDGTWPAPGTVIRVPFYRMERPPWAVKQTIAPNAIPTDHTKPTFGIPFRNNPDPIPVFGSIADQAAYDQTDPDPSAGLPSAPGDSLLEEWSRGDPSAVPASLNLAWFRIYRENGSESDRAATAGPVGATFIITVGSAGTLGYKDWTDVTTSGARGTFDFDSDLFDELLARERRQWYRVEWSPAVGGGEDHHYAFALAEGEAVPQASWYEQLPLNPSRFIEDSTAVITGPSQPRNYVGTIRSIERLPGPPSSGGW